ncbi:MAG: hypothetical protein IPP60_15925 [Sphingobacteriales bacterium]|nr:hypothetical protein [Sphingobacteriales bacterium]
MSFNHWNTYFAAHHQQQFSGIYWDDEDYLSSAERKLISSSIQQFQKGENSDGKNLLSKSAQLYDMNYTFAIQNFIKEEQNHSKALGTFMDLHSIERIQKHPLDVIFKSLLKFFSIGGIVVTLTTAEIISMVYYDALRKATGSKLLKDICTAILEDEVEHLKFQSQSLCAIYRTNFLKSILLGLYHSVLMRGTIAVIWLYHRAILKQGGIKSLAVFYERVMKEYYIVKLNTYLQLSEEKMMVKTV